MSFKAYSIDYIAGETGHPHKVVHGGVCWRRHTRSGVCPKAVVIMMGGPEHHPAQGHPGQSLVRDNLQALVPLCPAEDGAPKSQDRASQRAVSRTSLRGHHPTLILLGPFIVSGSFYTCSHTWTRSVQHRGRHHSGRGALHVWPVRAGRCGAWGDLRLRSDGKMSCPRLY